MTDAKSKRRPDVPGGERYCHDSAHCGVWFDVFVRAGSEPLENLKKEQYADQEANPSYRGHETSEPNSQ